MISFLSQFFGYGKYCPGNGDDDSWNKDGCFEILQSILLFPLLFLCSLILFLKCNESILQKFAGEIIYRYKNEQRTSKQVTNTGFLFLNIQEK